MNRSSAKHEYENDVPSVVDTYTALDPKTRSSEAYNILTPRIEMPCWFKENQSSSFGSGQSFSALQSGRFYCEAHNQHGSQRSDVVTVTDPPRSVSVSIIQSGLIWEGDSVTLICSSDSNPPALNFSWFKENQSSSVGSGQSFSALQSGRFYCEAHNQHGSQRSDAVTVIVNGRLVILYISTGVVCGAAAIITMLLICRSRMKKRNDTQGSQSGQIWEGDSVTLICSSDSNPPALNFSWFKENQSSSVGSGQSFSALQSGRFYCEAHNQHGSQRSDAVTVIVKGRLVILYISIGVVCGAAAIITMLLICRIRMKKRNDTQGSQMNHSQTHHDRRKACDVEMNEPVYENVMINHYRTHHDRRKACEVEMNEPVYENLNRKRP
ncbi:hypothetical protein Q8A67_005269 [Cirrhinus molitorella]|uniref:Ig-like domain-containing protein n=1 Tax=Cirrhinus molitorella TaxID=172907 RepID=A0AA88QC05_9TELE|nr:hypothetical protein Q8A67_005269 [Cirrhinus molitorella]